MEKYERYREKNVETKRSGCQILDEDRILIGQMRRIKRSFGRR